MWPAAVAGLLQLLLVASKMDVFGSKLFQYTQCNKVKERTSYKVNVQMKTI